ncbi:MAG TPA: hypothetical protein VIL48_00090 [Acidimicrobiales bacterium]
MPPAQTRTRPPRRAAPAPADARTNWTERVEQVLDRLPPPTLLPGFDRGTPLPTPDVFDEPIQSLERTAETFGVMADDLGREIDDLRWVCNDATRFRQQFSGTRRPQLADRARDLRDLADDLRAVQSRTRDEIEWIHAIERAVRDFLSQVQLAFAAARNAAAEALADARDAHRAATSALGNAVVAVGDVVRAGLDELTGGDGSDELAQAERRARAAVRDAEDALDAVVDFTTNWTFNGANLPSARSRAWYDVDAFMARKAQTPEAYGVPYAARGPYAP